MSERSGRERGLSPLGLGCSRLGSFNNPQPLAAGRELVRAALDLGVTVIDTSNIYGQGDSERQIGRALAGERQIGRALAGARDRAFLVTKAGLGFSGKMRALRPLKPLLRPLLARRGAGGAVTAQRDDAMRADWRPEAIAASLEGSLRRLRTDHVDGFLLHSPPAAIAGDAALADALARLKAAGKVRHFGVSCDDRSCFEAALAMPGLTMLQLPWDLVTLAATGPLGEAIRTRGILVLAREVIRLQPERAPPAAVAAAAAHPLVASALVGTTSRQHLAELAKAIG